MGGTTTYKTRLWKESEDIRRHPNKRLGRIGVTELNAAFVAGGGARCGSAHRVCPSAERGSWRAGVLGSTVALSQGSNQVNAFSMEMIHSLQTYMFVCDFSTSSPALSHHHHDLQLTSFVLLNIVRLLPGDPLPSELHPCPFPNGR
jgi:hypothetical protein